MARSLRPKSAPRKPKTLASVPDTLKDRRKAINIFLPAARHLQMLQIQHSLESLAFMLFSFANGKLPNENNRATTRLAILCERAAIDLDSIGNFLAVDDLARKDDRTGKK